MSEQPKQAIIRWFEEVWNRGRRQVIDELLSPDCVIHDGETSIKGPEEFKKYFDLMRSAFSEIKVTPEEAVSEGPLVPAMVGEDAPHWRWFRYAANRQECADDRHQHRSFH
jgi:hypothetical protein